MEKITVLIVDDSSLIRALFTEILSSEPDMEVIGTAGDPFEAREKIKILNPKVVTLDIEMPKMDGLSFLEKIMTLRPMPVVMASTLTQKGAEATIKALELGAVDYVAKPSGGALGQSLEDLRRDLTSKVRAAAQAQFGYRMKTASAAPAAGLSFKAPSQPNAKLIAIGSSTGGVEALRDIFLQLPANLPPIVMVQHMPATFTPSFAARLDSVSAVTVHEAADGMRLEQGHAYLAPGGRQMKIVKRGKDMMCSLGGLELVSGHCPSADVLFNSVAVVTAAQAVGVILTGMGKDGAEGLLKMRNVGASTIGQDKASCVVYGMPRVAHEIGAVSEQLALSAIPGAIVKLLERKDAHTHVS